MSFAWIAGASILALASFVFGLTGFGIGLVALSLLPFFLPLTTVVPLTTLYGAVFALVMAVQLRRYVIWPPVLRLLLGTVLGTPIGVWMLATLPSGLLKRAIGALLVTVVGLEWYGAYPRTLTGRYWSWGAGGLAGILGGAIGTPGPPVVVYVAAQGWSPRVMKAILQVFFCVNQSVIVAGHWWAGLLTSEVVWLAGVYAIPAALGVTAGIYLFPRIDQQSFRRLLFLLLCVLGLVLLVRG